MDFAVKPAMAVQMRFGRKRAETEAKHKNARTGEDCFAYYAAKNRIADAHFAFPWQKDGRLNRFRRKAPLARLNF